MFPKYQAATLVASPSYPNSLAWSMENLVAISSEHLITILNPASLTSARAVITISQNKPFPIGLVEKNDLLTPCLQPICLAKDTRPYAQSISWSPLGLAPNSGCFLAVCTTDGRVKLYRAPYCEYSSEWIEAADISDLLFCYLVSINYNEQLDLPLVIYGSEASNSRQTGSVCRKSVRIRKRKEPSCSIEGMHADPVGKASLHKTNPEFIKQVACSDQDEIVLEDIVGINENGSRNGSNQISDLPLITAKQYAFRNAILSSLVVTWSPILQSCESFGAILSVGAKSGAISFWRICEPQYYTIKHGSIPVNPMLVGHIQAHDSWITSICFGTFATSSSESQLILATGCSDGSVKIWSGNVEKLMLATKVRNDCFLLLAEVTTATFVPVSTISLIISAKSSKHAVLAIGRGSGKLEAWIYDILNKKLCFVADHSIHKQVVTGLAWTFDGCYLYSCSQDNSIRSWMFHGDSLIETPISSKFSASDNSPNLSRISDLCFGLAVSPGELILAVVRSLDANLQHQMYEKRSQKAVIEFFGIGPQSMEALNCSSFDPELVCWETTILRFLKCFEDADKPIVIWDAVALLRDLRKDFPDLVETILTKWISSWFSEPKKISFHGREKLLMIGSRKLHLLNIICRRVMLAEMDMGSIRKDDQLNNWNELLVESERELQERVVAFSFRAAVSHTGSSHCWSPVGVAQMRQWVAINDQTIHAQLKILESEVTEVIRDRNDEESCSFCSAAVPFESFEAAWCGSKGRRHKLTRCAVSMRLCSVTEPLWYCICCRRWAENLLPRSFFALDKSLIVLPSAQRSPLFLAGERSQPLCPFCGILLQRSLPDFLMSTSPV